MVKNTEGDVLSPPLRLEPRDAPRTSRAALKAAAARRVALLRAGLHTYTYVLTHYAQGAAATQILCLCCGKESPSKTHLASRYCSFCDVYYDAPFNPEVYASTRGL